MSDAVADAFAGFLSDPTVTAVSGALGAALVALWVAAAWWAYTDAARRTESTLASLVAASWIIVSTPLLVPFSLAIYRLARPQQTAAEGRSGYLAGALVDAMEDSQAGGCPVCGLVVMPGWLRCPSCANWLAIPCAGCETWSDPGLAACPFCGSEHREVPAVVPLPATAAPGPARSLRRIMRAGTAGTAGPQLQRDTRHPHMPSDGRLAPIRTR